MKGGLTLIAGVVFVFFAVILMLFVFVCNAPGTESSPFCQPIRPLIDTLSAFFG
ncbi:MAG: hypothetical protein J7K54_00935 [Candidatus Aenigmarchaeota archaeon]|nr:hypothetical protein [Candidatus Aenigmarchaeota archaeon]